MVGRRPKWQMGHRVAFGNTAEHYRRLVYGYGYGCTPRGSHEQGPLSHSPTIPGWDG